ncbi:MAG: MFS transporter [Burkholderiales bacterium]|nr:MFS transporter [Burkholderiales bacterium]
MYTKNLSRLIWMVCSLGLFIDGYILYISSITEPFIKVMFNPSSLQIGLIQASAPLGAAIGGIVMGRVSDKIGRKSMLIFNLLFFVIIAILSALSWNISSLCIFRFLIGLGVGMDYPICASYLAEMIPKNKTSKFIAAAMFLNCSASAVGVLIAWVIFTLVPSLHAWRFMLASSAIPAIIGLVLRSKLPESFIWQAHKNKIDINDPESFKFYKKLFSPKYLKLTICFSMCWFLMDISYYGIALFTPSILNALGVSGGGDLLHSAGTLIQSTLYVNIFVMLGAFASIFAIDRMDSIKLQKIGFMFSFLGLFIISISFFAQNHILNLILGFSGFILFNFFVNFGPGITTYLLPVQLYPTEIRATGHGFAAGSAKLGAFLGTILVPVVQLLVGVHLTILVLSFTLILGLILSYWIPPIHRTVIELDSQFKDDVINEYT